MPVDEKKLEAITAEVEKLSKGVEPLKELGDSLRRDLTAARGMVDELGTKLSKSDQDTKNKLDTFGAAIEAKHTAIEKVVAEIKQTALEAAAALQRTPLDDDDRKAKAVERKHASEYKRVKLVRSGALRVDSAAPVADQSEIDGYAAYAKAFNLGLRRGERELGGVEIKALSVGSDPDGGYLVPMVVSSRIIDKVFETSPLRQLATVETIGTDALHVPVDIGEADAGWVGEQQARPTTNTPTIEQQRIQVHELYAKPKATQQLLEDAAIDVEAWLARKVAEKFARVEATAFISGNGVGRPRGILTYPAGTTAFARSTVLQIPTLSAAAITADGLVNMIFALKGPYLTNARWLMARGAIGAVALLKDGNGQYIWRPGLDNTRGASLLGYPISQADDMPAVTAGSLSIAFGDFRQAYTVVERLGINTLRDPYSAKPFVEFYTRRRVGGDVVNFEAYVLGVTSAS